MPLWRSTLSYVGTEFHGWQIQPTLPTIQGALARAIYHITGESVLPQGAGRTDAGVHALGQVATFSLACPIPAANLQRALNRTLPPSVRVLTLELAEPGFHARHSAQGKTYEYRILPAHPERICSPMLAPFVWDCPLAPDLDRLRTEAAYIVGTHDFSSFAAHDPDLSARISSSSSASRPSDEASAPLMDAPPLNVRTITHSDWTLRDDLLIYTVTGSGFLHHMVRNLVGTFVELAGTRRLRTDTVAILAARSRSAAGPTAPPQGLFLVEVHF